jgi:heme oxygenase (biliverdin-IX-beta and delta-forming)
MSTAEQELIEAAESLSNSLSSVQLATLSSDGEPNISYTPFTKYNGDIYIFISELANHTKNITEHPLVSALFIEDEQDSKNIFARKRLTLKCQCKELARTHSEWSIIMEAFEEKLGKTVALLRSLPDFHLFKLSPISGTYVKGFGQAFELESFSFSGVRLD